MGMLIAALAFLGFAPPATACAYSRPVFTAAPVGTQQGQLVEAKVRVERALFVRDSLVAVRATVLRGTNALRRGGEIIIVVPSEDTADCHYAGLADPKTVSRDGSLEGHVILRTKHERLGVFSAQLASERDRFRYGQFAQGTIRGEWRRARFGSGDE